MNLTELLKYLYTHKGMPERAFYMMAFHYINDKNYRISYHEATSVLFLDKDKICYRTSFEIIGNRVQNSYGLDIDINSTIPYTDDPKHLKEVLSIFYKKLKAGEITDEFFGETFTSPGTKPPIIDMKESKMKDVLGKMMEVNKESAIRSAKVEMGKAANQLVLDKLTPRLPMMVRGYADSPLAELIVGNVVAGLLIQFAPGNDKAQILSDAMIAAGVQVALESFDIPALVNELLENIDVAGLAE